jgi:predicted O-methyltransferase YrrM
MKTVIGFGQNLLTYEASYLLGLARSLPEQSHAVNIGGGEGISAAAILEGAELLGHFHLFSVDLVDCEAERELVKHLKLDDPNRFEQVIMDSKDFAKEWTKDNLQLVFVDGSHAYEPALYDMTVWGELLEPGGLLIAHDYRDPRQKQVTKAVQEWRAKTGKAWIRLGRVLHTIAFQKPGGEDWGLGRL